jgi:hypothetical protein
MAPMGGMNGSKSKRETVGRLSSKLIVTVPNLSTHDLFSAHLTRDLML